jgi:hypothetical protein
LFSLLFTLSLLFFGYDHYQLYFVMIVGIVRINDTARGFVSAGLFKRWKRLHPTHIAAPARHVVGAFCRRWYGRFRRVQGCIVGDSGRLRVSGTDHRWRGNIRRRHGRVMHESSTLSSLLMGSKQWDAQL